MYAFDGRIRFSEVNEKGEISLMGIVNYLQDAAGFHGEEVGYGVEWTKQTGLAWILTSMQMQVLKRPRFGSRIRMETWSTGFKGCLGTRQYAMRDEEGELLVMANSKWVYMNLPEGKPVNVPEEQKMLYGVDTELIYAHDIGKRKIRKPKEGNRRESSFMITEHQLDTNHHVNNGQYILMAEKYLPLNFVTGKLRVEFRNQAHAGDVIIPVIAETEGIYTITLENPAGEAYFVGEFTQL